MQKVEFYIGKTLKHTNTINEDKILNISLTASVDGSLAGTIEIEANAFTRSVRMNTHFLKIYYQTHVFGAVIVKADTDKNITTIEVGGFSQYLENVDMYPYFKEDGSINKVNAIAEENKSFQLQFSADGPVGVLYAILLNQKRLIAKRGYGVPFDDSGLLPYITNTTTNKWARSFRMNSAEIKSLDSVFEQLTTDPDFPPISFTTTPNQDDFKWVMNVVTSYGVISLDEAVDPIGNIVLSPDDVNHAAISMAGGTDLRDRDLIAYKKFQDDQNLAYSVDFVENNSEQTSVIGRIIDGSQRDAREKDGQLSFQSYSSNIPLFSLCKVKGTTLTEKNVIITQIEIEGQKTTYTGQVVKSNPQIINKLNKPTNLIKDTIFKPLNYATTKSRKVDFRKPNPTGFKS